MLKMRKRKTLPFGMIMLAAALLVAAVSFILLRQENKLSPFDWSRSVKAGEEDSYRLIDAADGRDAEMTDEEFASLISALNEAQPGVYSEGEKRRPLLILEIQKGGEIYQLCYADDTVQLQFNAEAAALYDAPEEGVWQLKDPKLNAEFHKLQEKIAAGS